MSILRLRGWFSKATTQSANNRHRRPARLLKGLTRLEQRIQPATFVVSNILDSGAGSLREAVTKANAALGADVIDLTGVTGTISLLTALPTVIDSVAINGPGASKLTVQLDATAPNGRIFTISGTNSITGLTLSGGRVTDNGGAVFLYGRATISNCVISGNATTTTLNFQGGGGIFVADDSHLTLLNSVVTGNTSGAVGGAIFGAYKSIVTIRDCAITNNSAGINGFGAGGGGVYFGNQGTLLLANTTVSGNVSTGTGAGIYIYGTNAAGTAASWVIAQSTISNNTSTGASGGGIRVQSDNQLVLLASTISGNTAMGTGAVGGGISVIYGGTIFMQSTIVAGNSASTANDISNANATTATNSAFSDTTGFTVLPATNKIDTFANLKLGPLQDNGGLLLPNGSRIQTQVPLAGSPLIDAGVNVFTQGLDQRGYSRTTGAAVADIGAGEFGSEALAGTIPSLTLSYVSNGVPSFELKVTYTDDTKVQFSSITKADLSIIGPSTIKVTDVKVTPGSDSATLVATYTITPMDDSWDAADIGTYVVNVVAGEVTDTSLNPISGGTLGKFNATPPPQVFTVINTADTGAGSLRDALDKANASTGTHDTIGFAVGTGKITISPASQLPTVTDEVTIDGTTQPGYASASPPVVQLDGGAVAGRTGLVVESGKSSILGLNVRNFGFTGILLRGGDGNTIQNCFIGTNQLGTAAAKNGYRGIFIQDSNNNLIGGPTAQNRNIVSGNADHGICVLAGSNNVFQNNYVGTNVGGTAAVANAIDGLFIGRGSQYNLLTGNVISGNGNHGMEIYDFGTTRNRVQTNKIGTTASGLFAIANKYDGVVAGVNASNNIIGTDGDGINDAAEGNQLSANGRFGIYLYNGSSENLVAGNTIGTDPSGQFDLGNGSDGVLIETFGDGQSSVNNIIGTNGDGVSDALEGNLVSGNGRHGVCLIGFGINFSRISGNTIGTSRDGTSAIGNTYDAVAIHYGAVGSIVGTNGDGISDVLEGNLCSGNGRFGVMLYQGSADSRVSGNKIGTDITGQFAIRNANDGVIIWGGGTRTNNNNVIGTNGDGLFDAIEGNLIAGNGRYGVEVYDVGNDGNRIAGNMIGLNADGNAKLPNEFEALVLHFGATNNIVGTNGDGVSDALERNVISGSPSWGVVIARAGTTGNVVAGNYIGTDITGTVALGNGRAGVWIFLGATNNRVGTNSDGKSDALEGNLISGNGVGFPAEKLPGVLIADAGTTGNVVAGNRIGTDVTGTLSLPNFRNGISIQNGSTNNTVGFTIGGPAVGANTIGFNGGAGVGVADATTQGNLIHGNSVFKNATIGIDLGNDGVTANDPLDSDGGPNTLLNYPVLTAAKAGASTTVSGTYDSAASFTVTLDFFASPAGSTGGEGKRYLGSTMVTTDGTGTVTFTDLILASATTPGEVITATATDGSNNTSEFSAAQSTGSPAKVSTVMVNNGAVQRSEVTTLKVAFDQVMNFPATPADAFQLKRQSDSASVNLLAVVDNTGPGSLVTITFTGGAVNFISLQDGRYTLTIDGSMVSNSNGNLDGDANGTAGGNYVLIGDPSVAPKLYRLFGDVDADNDVDTTDFAALRIVFGGAGPVFDFDNDGDVDTGDYGQFRARFGSSV